MPLSPDDPTPDVRVVPRMHLLVALGGTLLGTGGALYLTTVLLGAYGHIADWARASMLSAAVALIMSGVAALIGGRLDRRNAALAAEQARGRRDVGRVLKLLTGRVSGAGANGTPVPDLLADAELRGFLAAQLPPDDNTGWSSATGGKIS